LSRKFVSPLHMQANPFNRHATSPYIRHRQATNYFSFFPIFCFHLSCGSYIISSSGIHFNLNKLQRIHNTLAKLVNPSHTCSSDALHTLHRLPVRQRINFKIATLTFKLLQHSSPAYLASLIQPYVPSRALRSHGQQLLAQPYVRTSIGSRAFRAAAPKIWNSLPLLTRLSPSLESFKRALKTHFFTTQS
jgi:hypothetical protein